MPERGGPSPEEMGIKPEEMQVADDTTQESGRFLVGIERNPDGSLDTSRAASFKPSKEVIQSPDVPTEEVKEEKTRPKLDTAFGSQVRSYFNKRLRIETGDDDHESFLTTNKMALERLSNSDMVERSDPREFTGALAELAGVMGGRNPDIAANKIGIPKVDAENDKQYIASKRLFMESYRKLHPDQKIGLSGAEYAGALEKLRDNSDIHAAVDIPAGQDIDRIIKNNPKALAAEIDRLLTGAGDFAKAQAFGVHNGETSKQFVQESVDRTTGSVEAIFRLQSLRDQLRTKIYGRSTSLPEEERTDLLAARERFGFAASQLRPNLDLPNQTEWNMKEDDLSRWDQVGEKLELLRREYTKDKRPPWDKKEEYEQRVRQAFV